MNYLVPPQPIDDNDPSSVGWSDWYTKVRYAINQSGLDFSALTGVPPNLVAISPLSGTGFAARTGTTTWSLRTLQAGTAISISNPAGIAGDPTITNTGVTSLAGTASQISVDVATGAVTISLPSAVTMPGSLLVTTTLTVNGNATFKGNVSLGDALIDTIDIGPSNFKNTANNFTFPICTSGVNVTINSTGTSRALNIQSGTLEMAGSAGSAGQVLKSNGLASTPAWTTLSTLAVTSLTGTANQITVSASTGAVTISLPSAVTLPGSLIVTTTLAVNGDTTLGDANTDLTTVNGRVTINVPSAGDALTITAVTGSAAIRVTGADFGVPLLLQGLTAAPNNQTLAYIGTSTSALTGTNGDLILVPRTSTNAALRIYTGNAGLAAERFNITGPGNVTINAPTSGVALTITGVAGSAVAAFKQGTGTGAFISVAGNNTTPGTSSFDLQQDSSSNVDIVNRSNTRMSFYTNATEYLRIAAAGNLTAFTPSSGTALTVNGIASGTIAAFTDGTNTISILGDQVQSNVAGNFRINAAAATGVLVLRTNGSDRVTIGSGGLVTINGPGSGFSLKIVNDNNGNLQLDNVTSTNDSRMGFYRGGTQFGFIGNAGTAGNLINDSAAGDMMVRVESHSFRVSTNSGTSSSFIITSGGATSFPNIGTTASAANAFLNNAASNDLLRSTSSRKYKKNIRPMDDSVSSSVMQLQPVMYKSRAPADDPDVDWYGLIAEDVYDINPRLVHYDADGKPDAVQYDRLAVLLINEVKKLRQELDQLQRKMV